MQLKIEALWLKSKDISHHQIFQLSGITENTTRTYFWEYEGVALRSLKKSTFIVLKVNYKIIE
jgi:hypothetical protein